MSEIKYVKQLQYSDDEIYEINATALSGVQFNNTKAQYLSTVDEQINILNTTLDKLIPPAEYKKPTISLSRTAGTEGTYSGNVELGSTVITELTATFTENDAGALSKIEIKQDGNSVKEGTGSPLDYSGSFTINKEEVSFTASASYAETPANKIKQDITGRDSVVNKIPAGTITSGKYTFKAKRKAFFGGGSGSLPTTIDSTTIRNLGSSLLAPANGSILDFKVLSGQQHIIIAYPDTLRDVTQIMYVDVNDPNMAPLFTKSTTSVVDASGTNGITYKVYTYELAVPTKADMTFKVTI